MGATSPDRDSKRRRPWERVAAPGCGKDAVWPQRSAADQVDLAPAFEGTVLGLPRAWVMALGLCAGISTVVVSYGLGRAQSPAALPLFWVGQCLAFGSAFFACVDDRITDHQRRWVVLLFAVGQGVLTYAYSSVVFRFTDELQHMRTLQAILDTNHLFTPNFTLPVSPEFPGLEILTVSIMHATGAPAVLAGRVIGALSHLLLAGSAFVLARSVRFSERVASATALMMVASSTNIMLNTLFLYGTLALPYVWLVIVAAMRPQRSKVVLPAVLAIGSGVVLVVTHHVSALIALGGVGGILSVALVARRWTIVGRLLLVMAVTIPVGTAWVIRVAPDVVGYLSKPFINLLEIVTAQTNVSAPASLLPSFGEALFSISSVALMSGLCALGAFFAWRERAPRRALLFLVCSLAYIPLTAARALGAGADIAVRTSAYTGGFTGAALGVVAVILVARRNAMRFVAVALAVVIYVGNIMNGWPGDWERVPGRPYANGFEAGVTGDSLLLAGWAKRNLNNNDRVACDLSTCSTMFGYSKVAPVRDAGMIFAADSLGASAIDDVASHSIHYVALDRRMATQDPVTGLYFENTLSGVPIGRLSPRAITKFRDDPQVLIPFANATYAVYDLRALTKATRGRPARFDSEDVAKHLKVALKRQAAARSRGR